MSNNSGWLVPLERLENARHCGAKAYNLGRLARASYPVPCGIAILDAAMQRHLVESGVLNDCHALLVEFRGLEASEVRKRASSIRSRILKTPLSAELRADIAQNYNESWSGKRLAVRSSGICEDTKQASFAGQFDSVLDVDTQERLEIAILTVWASLWSDRCLLYARRKGLNDARMGVVIQEMVDAQYSGVLFSRDPCATGTSEEVVIEYTCGLGDLLAAGQTTPGRARVCHQSLSLTHEDTGAEKPCSTMPDATLRELARIGLDLERKFESPQDIEWSIDAAERIMLLQTRPITVADPSNLVAWSNANIAENYPNPVSPFLSSIVSQGYTAYFRELGLAFGISRHRIAAMEEAFENVVGVHAGRLYYNLTNIHTLINLAPCAPWLIGSFNEFTGAREVPQIALINSGPVRRAAELVRIVAKTTWQYLRIQSRVARFERTVDQYAARTHPDTLAMRAPRELLGLIKGFLEIRVRRWNDAALADVASMVCYRLLKLFLSRRLGSSDEAGLHNDLLTGLPELASTRPATELWRLSRVIRDDPALFKLFSEHSPDEVLARLDRPQWSDFQDRLDRYLNDWGFRNSGELMLTNPTPQEKPEPVIHLLQAYACEAGAGPEGLWTKQSLRRRRVTELTAERLTPSGWWRRFPLSRAVQFRLLLRATQGAIRLRERARMKQALLYTRLRHVMLNAGDVLVRKGQLESRDQIFFLTVDEVQILLSGAAISTATTLRTVKLRREEFTRFDAARPPDSFHLPWGEQWSPDTMSATTEDLPSESALRGTGACGGMADGTASVVLDVTEADRVRSGQILVTRQTDPGWAAVFFLIKGLVVERGGMLSHGAIIAREYGIPTVVGVPEATHRIRSGDRLRLNGDSGLVELCH
jgi:pyruvate,water dikinase